MPDPGWTGHWRLPRVLTRPLTSRQRGGVVALAAAGMGPKRLVAALAGAVTLDTALGDFVEQGPDALAALRRACARAVVPGDEEYPSELAAIDAAPPLLFVRGARLDELRPVVAIVGARACTSGAARFARRLGGAFAGAGFTVASGLARGIDAAAHTGALEVGRSIAVLGTGIDVVYPAEHRELASRIAASGALVTEFPLGVGPRAWHFPARNRIIAGLCAALVVVEAGTSSGALITAGFALDQGREVLACITGPENPAGGGTRELLKDGATLVVDAEQAVEIVCATVAGQGFAFGAPRPLPARVVPDGLPGRVYEAVLDGSTIDEIASASGLSPARVGAVLAELELDGLVSAHAGRWSRSA